MADETGIEWCDSTFNPWRGCTKISPACDHCFAEKLVVGRFKLDVWGAGKPRVRSSPAYWRKPLRWNARRFMQCNTCGWRGECAAELIGCGRCRSTDHLHDVRRRVFCASLADVFDNEVPPAWRADLLALIRQTPNLDWLLLTKRIGNAEQMLQDACEEMDVGMGIYAPSIYPNLWLGATICNQAEADRDIPKLLATPAAVRFVSIEPMLGPIDLTNVREAIGPRGRVCYRNTIEAKDANPAHTDLVAAFGPDYPYARIDWVIAGGESGVDARPSHPDWFRKLRDDCLPAGVPFLFKQWGEWHTSVSSMVTGESCFLQFESFSHWVNKASTWVRGGVCLDHDGAQLRNGSDMQRASEKGKFPVTIMHRVGKKTAGRHLDGCEHTAFPRGYDA